MRISGARPRGRYNRRVVKLAGFALVLFLAPFGAAQSGPEGKESALDGDWLGGRWGLVRIDGDRATFEADVRSGTIEFEAAGESCRGTWRESDEFGGAVRFQRDASGEQLRGRYWTDPSGEIQGDGHVFVLRRKAKVEADAPTYRVQVLEDREKFDALMHGMVRVVDFDDIDTEKEKPRAFEADRYERKKGVLIEGDRGQFVCTEFKWPTQFVANSKPNTYAPGPKNGDSTFPKGGSETDVRFSVKRLPASVSGFGCMFHDVDNSFVRKSWLIAYDRAGRELGKVGGFRTPDGGKIWRGLVAVNEDGVPVPVIASVRLLTGDGWPERSDGEGVSVDDLVYSIPIGWRKPR